MDVGDQADPAKPQDPAEFLAPAGSRHFMLNLFIVSLAVLFAATIAGFLIFRYRFENWPPEGMPAFPPSMWISTFLIIGCSMALQLGLGNIRAGRVALLKSCMTVTVILAVMFLANQLFAWSSYLMVDLPVGQANLYKFTFYMLVGLHGLHLIGGLVPLVSVTAAANRGSYTQASHEGVELLVKYWHFLGAVWLVIFITLMATA